ncbi:hypothetical protein T459_04655 [Capsicum annuum]|uniref:Transposase-associated domain-containing protein n=1 Tax=Capsicum annuum TaxID=4072 RepID=A0A2G3A5M8_CAPAN|nr:hypothetical protein T459_04655 [Capsicum annuum]
MELLWPEDAESTTSMGVFPKEMEFRVPLGPRSLKGLVWGNKVLGIGKELGFSFFPDLLVLQVEIIEKGLESMNLPDEASSFSLKLSRCCWGAEGMSVMIIGSGNSGDNVGGGSGVWGLYPNRAGLREEYKARVAGFIAKAMTLNDFLIEGTIRCPCWNCKCCKLLSPDAVRLHLYRKGFMLNYTVWTAHRESSAANNFAFQNYVEISIRENNVESSRYSEMVRDVFGTHLEAQNEPNDEAKYFYEQLKEASHPLYEG